MKINELLEDTKNYRSLSKIASDIKKDWKNLSPHAKPYLDAMFQVDVLADKYYLDDARSIVLYFLSNASSWKGEVAKKIKTELKGMLANKPIKESVLPNKISVDDDKWYIHLWDRHALIVLSMFDDEAVAKVEASKQRADARKRHSNADYDVSSGKMLKRLYPKQVSEALLVEGINFAVMQQKIFDYVLKKLKELNPGMHASYAAELARTTDQFFTTAFDDAYEAFNKAEDKVEIEDNLGKAIEAVSNVIVDFFADENNHPTGYAARKLVGIDYDTPTKDEIESLIKKIDPTLERELANRS